MIAIWAGKAISLISRTLKMGAGATWPGEIALRIKPSILTDLSKQFSQGIILVAGTNGKTTTSLMIKRILEGEGKKVVLNDSGANLLNGLVSACIKAYSPVTSYDWGVFEVDENSLPIVLKFITPKAVVLLNLFRDQLDRYGEVDAVGDKWTAALKKLGRGTTMIVNADDPYLAFIGSQLASPTEYFGLEDTSLYQPRMEHATDTIYCPQCGNRLTFGGVYFSHMGKWACGQCGFRHPDVVVTRRDFPSPLEGTYNSYNTLAAAGLAHSIGVSDVAIRTHLSKFTPAFGRLETVPVGDKFVKIILSKNPTGFNESLRTLMSSPEAGSLLLALNDRIPDGRDISWIWDVDFERLAEFQHQLVLSGDRAWDLGVRMKYARETGLEQVVVRDNLQRAVAEVLEKTAPGKTAWVLATYSAMLEVRELVIGRKIL